MAHLAELIKTLDLTGQNVVPVEGEVLTLVQRKLLEMLDDFISVCDEHHISWMMGGGSALGTVRHHGFIPWDDDIDLNMPRADFERFLPLFRERFGDKYYIYVPGETKGYDYLLVHIMTRDVRARALPESTNLPTGICLDLFIIENAPDSALLRKLHGIWCMGMRYLVSCARFRRNREEMLTICRSSPELERMIRQRCRLASLYAFIPMDTLMRWMSRAFALCHNPKTRWVVMPSGAHQFFGELYPRDPYLRTTEMEFMGRKVLISQDYEAYLHNLYGDYSQIPEETTRGRHTMMELDVEALRRSLDKP